MLTLLYCLAVILYYHHQHPPLKCMFCYCERPVIHLPCLLSTPSPMAGLLVFSCLPLAAVPPPAELPPSIWWGPLEDMSLLVGTFKHGYECYPAMQADPSLSFLAHCGAPPCLELEAAAAAAIAAGASSVAATTPASNDDSSQAEPPDPAKKP